MFLCQDLAFFLAWARMKVCNGSDYPEESLLRGAFSLENIRSQGAMAAAHVNSQSLLNARRGLPEKTQGKWTQRMRQDSCEEHFLWKKTRSVGAADRITYKFTIALSARRTFIEKTHGIWQGFRDARFAWKKIRNPGAVGRITYKFTVALNARRILPEKTKGVWGVGTTRIFLGKHKELAGLVMRDI